MGNENNMSIEDIVEEYKNTNILVFKEYPKLELYCERDDIHIRFYIEDYKNINF